MAITKVTRTLLSTGIVDNSNATAITIDSSENVGIGTSSPNELLTLYKSTAAQAATQYGNSNTGDIISTKHFSEDYYPVSIIEDNNAGNRNKSKHTTQKPVSLMSYLIQTYSEKEQTIIDPFMGSGTTAITSHQLDRNWIGSEISQEYVDLANKRIQPYLDQQTLF